MGYDFDVDSFAVLCYDNSAGFTTHLDIRPMHCDVWPVSDRVWQTCGTELEETQNTQTDIWT